jgi:flagellar biosynthesis protein FlhG
MKRIEDQTYYEILEISPTATSGEIQKAYDRARETFHADSLAVYSLFSEKEVSAIQARIEEAYRILTDDGLRKDYDQSHLPPENVAKPQESPGAPSSLELPREQEPLVYRGKTLKRIRENSGMNLRVLSSETKINPRILEWIEEEIFDKLPAEVYLKGFLKAYAQCLGLVPQKVIDGYLEFMKDNRGK